MTPNFVRCAVCNVHLSQLCLAGCCRRPPCCRPSESVTIYCQCREVKLWCGYILTSAARQTGLDRANRSQSERWEVLVVRNRNQIVHQKCYIQINVLRTSCFPLLFFTWTPWSEINYSAACQSHLTWHRDFWEFSWCYNISGASSSPLPGRSHK